MSLAAATAKTRKFTLNGVKCDAKCVSVYDGDTAQMVFEPFAGMGLYRFSCRFAGYNSAEIKGSTAEEKTAAKAARDALAGMILDKIVHLSIGEFDKYGRPLVEVTCDYTAGALSNHAINVNKWMLENGHGKPYTGAGDKEW